MSREQFESLLAPFANRSVELIARVLTDIHFEPAMIDQVVMVGGSSSIPLLQRKVRELFGPDKVLIHPRPMLAITEGAAILAHRLADQQECPQCGKDAAQTDRICASCGFDLAADLTKRGVRDIVHSVSHDYYLELEDGSDQLLVEKNTPLPVKTQGTFSLLHSEQRLAHFKFFNRVGDTRESIGDLWLSFDDIAVESKNQSENQPAQVTLDFEIDEDNIITVAAALKGQADVKVSRTLSRGGPDERLFLDLEQAITKVNSEQHEYWVTYDFLQWVTQIAKRINDVVDPKTGKGNMEVVEQTKRQLRTARDLAERNETTYSQLFYAEDLLKQFGHLMPENERKDLDRSIDALKTVCETGTAESIVRARGKMEKETGRQSKFSIFANIDHAIDLQYRESPTQAERLIRQRAELFKLMEKNDLEKSRKLLSELIPEVHGIIDRYSKQKLHIWKGVRKID
ncbi:Molecular chaperone DnaK [Gammaproteobacteria bacterium]